MKKLNIRVLAPALLLLALLAGCGGPSEKAEPVGTPEPTSAAPATMQPESPAPTEETTAEDEAIPVSTAGEFLEAIAPGAEIELAPGTYNLTAYLSEASETVSDYVARGFTDGWQAEIHGVEGLTIRGAAGGKIEVVAEPRYSDVLNFSDCSDIVIENVTFGHTIEQGHCEGAVLSFDHCRNIRLDALDLYGCGTYGVAASDTADLVLKNCIVRDCSYGIIDLSSCGNAALEGCTLKDNGGFDMLSLHGSFVDFENCTFTGNMGSGFLPSDSESGAHFASCSFGQWESRSIREELKTKEGYAFDEDCLFEGYSWAELTATSDDPGDSETNFVYVALDTALLKVAAFDAQVLTADEYYILYELVDRASGEVTYETSDDVRFLTFDADGRGCFWTDNEKGRPFSYEMDSDYSCQVSFDDGGKASFGLYADQGGALPRISEEGHIWLALYTDDEVLWFY